MLKVSITIAALTLLGSGLANAKEKVDPRIGAAIACRSITQNEQRLRCYDQAIAGLRLALDSGQLVPAGESRKPLALEGVIKDVRPFGYNRYWVELDSGDRWEVISESSRDVSPRKGAKVKLEKGTMGGYWFIDPTSVGRRAKYQGRL